MQIWITIFRHNLRSYRHKITRALETAPRAMNGGILADVSKIVQAMGQNCPATNFALGDGSWKDVESFGSNMLVFGLFGQLYDGRR